MQKTEIYTPPPSPRTTSPSPTCPHGASKTCHRASLVTPSCLKHSSSPVMALPKIPHVSFCPCTLLACTTTPFRFENWNGSWLVTARGWSTWWASASSVYAFAAARVAVKASAGRGSKSWIYSEVRVEATWQIREPFFEAASFPMFGTWTTVLCAGNLG